MSHQEGRNAMVGPPVLPKREGESGGERDRVECMSQSELFYGIPSLSLTLSMVYGIGCMCVHCMTKPFVMRDLVVSISSVLNCRSGRQEWLF